MGRPGRTLLILAGVAAAGVAGLLVLAERYGDMLGQRPLRGSARESLQRAAGSAVAATELPPAPRATRSPAEWLDAFLVVRTAMRAALATAPGATPAERLALLETARLRALGAANLGDDEYRQVREVWRRVRRGEGAPTAAFAEAFRERPERLEGADLGDMEPYDP